MSYEFKAGDRVKHIEDEDVGTFMYYHAVGRARVKWDKDGELSSPLESIYLDEASNNKEQEAVMLLLSLGYTVSKNKV